MLFFQLLLFAATPTPTFSSAGRPPRVQKRIHLTLLGLAVLLLAAFALFSGVPLAPPPAWKPAGSAHPALRILGLLAATVGLPYSSSRRRGLSSRRGSRARRAQERIWRLYALSNLGSLLALVAYPFPLRATLRAPDPGLGLVRVRSSSSCSAPGAAAGRQARICAGVADAPPEPGGRGRRRAVPRDDAPLGRARLLRVAASPRHHEPRCARRSAVFPFLWDPAARALPPVVRPLLRADAFPWRPVASLLFIASLVPVCIVLFKGATESLAAQIGALAATLFAACLVCHGELYRLRPSPRHLTTFYLVIAGGGRAGGVFAGVVAPVLFQGSGSTRSASF